MKKLNYFILFCVIALLSISCSKDSEDDNNSSNGSQSVEITINGGKHEFYINNCQYDADLTLFTFGIYNNQNPLLSTMSIDCFSYYDINSSKKTDFSEDIYMIVSGNRYDYKSGKAQLTSKDTSKQTMVFNLDGVWSNKNDEKEVIGVITLEYELE